MKILFVKEIEEAGETFIDLVCDQSGDTSVDSVYLQLTEDDTMSVTGAIKDASGVTQDPLSLIALKDYSVVESATEAGIYVLDGTGLSSITISLTAGKKVIVRAMI